MSTDRILVPRLGSLRAQAIQYSGSELSCFDRPQLGDSAPRACCQCHRDSAQTCGKFGRSRVREGTRRDDTELFPFVPQPGSLCGSLLKTSLITRSLTTVPGCRRHAESLKYQKENSHVIKILEFSSNLLSKFAFVVLNQLVSNNVNLSYSRSLSASFLVWWIHTERSCVCRNVL